MLVSRKLCVCFFFHTHIMNFILGLLSFSDINILLTEIQARDIRKFSLDPPNEIGTLPVVLAKLDKQELSLLHTGGDQFSVVLYIPDHVILGNIEQQQLYNELDRLSMFILVLDSRKREFPKDDSILLEAEYEGLYNMGARSYNTRYSANYVKHFVDIALTVRKWNAICHLETANDSVNRAELARLSECARSRIMDMTDPGPINDNILNIMIDDMNQIDFIKSLADTVDNATAGKAKEKNSRLKGLETWIDEEEVILSATGPDDILYGTWKSENPEDEEKDRKKIRKGGEKEETICINSSTDNNTQLSEENLGKLTDQFSLFVRTAVGSIGMSMMDAFISIPDIDDIKGDGLGRTPMRMEAFYLALKPMVRSALNEVDIWIRFQSGDRTTLNSVIQQIRPLDPSTPSIDLAIHQACGKLVGIEIASQMSRNPNRGLETRFTIPELKAKHNDAIGDLKRVLKMKFKIGGGGGRIQQRHTFRFPETYYMPITQNKANNWQ